MSTVPPSHIPGFVLHTSFDTRRPVGARYRSAFVLLLFALLAAPLCRTVAGAPAQSGGIAPAVSQVGATVQSAAQDLEGSAARFVNRELAQTTALYFACFGIYLLLGILFLIYWRWLRRDLPMLSVGLLALVMAVHTASISGSLPFVLAPLVDVQTGMAIEMVCYLLLNGFIAFMLWAFFPDAFRPRATDWIGGVNSSVAGCAAVASVVLAALSLMPGGDAAIILAVSRWITVVLMIVVTALAIHSIESRRAYGKMTAVGLGLLVVGSIHDVYFADIGLAGRPYLITFAVLGFVLLQTYVLLRRSAESTHMAQVSSRRLRREVEARTKELRAASVAAQAANMAKTEFVTAVTHELRTPLSSLLGYVDLIRDEVRDDLAPEHLEFFDNLELSAERLLNLVNNLLDLAKIESGRIDVTMERVDVAAIVEDVRNQLYPLAHERQLYVKMEINTEETCLESDEQWLSVALANLVSNGVKYTNQGGVTIRVESATLGECPALSVMVIDTGPGISSEFMPQLFQRFSREQRARDHAPAGTGLGLTITRELVERLGGEISVESRVGQGSTFTVMLPLHGGREAS